MKDTDEKLTYVVEQIGGINKTLEFQSKQLETHIHRTELLEERVKPIEDHVKFIRGVIGAVSYMVPIGSLVVAILKYMRKI